MGVSTAFYSTSMWYVDVSTASVFLPAPLRTRKRRVLLSFALTVLWEV